MKRYFPALALAAALAAPAAAFAQAARTIPMRDFFRNPDQAGHQISLDGRYISWAAPYERRLNVFVRPTAGGAATRSVPVPCASTASRPADTWFPRSMLPSHS